MYSYHDTITEDSMTRIHFYYFFIFSDTIQASRPRNGSNIWYLKNKNSLENKENIKYTQ
jgi:hypothetical protein